MKTTNDSFIHMKDKMLDNGQMAPQEMALRIMADLRRRLPDILKHHPVLLAYAYGSVAAGCPTPLSDVDIALVLAPTVGWMPTSG
jgi:predicted nucleotidyltransferase